MNHEKIGQFIATLRKEKQLTQKELAEKLHITDKAVSKWERSVSYPDITLLPVLSEILGVTVSELLNGERSTPSADTEATVDNALGYAANAVRGTLISMRNILALSFSLILLLGMLVSLICDLAISGGITWSVYPIASSVLAWFILIPIIRFGRNGILYAIIALTVLIIPFLLVLDAVIAEAELLLPIGIGTSFISIAFLWAGYVIFRLMKRRVYSASAFSLLLMIPFCLAINAFLSLFVPDEPFMSITFSPAKFIDLWDILAFGVIGAVSAILFAVARVKER